AHAAGTGTPGAVGAGELRGRAAFAARLRREAGVLRAALGEAEAMLRRAAAETDGRRGALAAARAAVRAVERHRERWRADEDRARGRREEAAADDLVTARRAAP
ncbi:MAG TPA: hypothetical protein VFK90_09675, partial [Anaeromyxobacter sp.]|nr:hypothetical protein [Anaeromyxobacter sp.]